METEHPNTKNLPTKLLSGEAQELDGWMDSSAIKAEKWEEVMLTLVGIRLEK